MSHLGWTMMRRMSLICSVPSCLVMSYSPRTTRYTSPGLWDSFRSHFPVIPLIQYILFVSHCTALFLRARCSKTSNSLNHTVAILSCYFFHQMQCPAVSTQRGPIRVPPQVWWKRLPCFTCREIWRKMWKENGDCAGTFTGESEGYSTCQGQLCGRASSPFTTLLVSGLTAGVPHPKTASTLQMQWMQCFIWSLTSATLLTEGYLEQQEG